ncbi:hypothetical protein SMU63_03743 [Streptococcus mutans T4]|nr:hypothetical protein SMU22_09057 [Streptococcus mutans 4SM1]EMC00608.1 hypothetical protein SMU63_03743 [Streptococcus mutans T4]EMC09164.1 hypothetical protein SMU72_03243 [Streptococcus mutans NLML9]EMC11840.1 hypothetical protein SMU75_04369 [Streptococcus mutans N3209]EMC24953.1 hypothetical protein SMU81_00275 [Streptococcus mutans SF14]
MQNGSHYDDLPANLTNYVKSVISTDLTACRNTFTVITEFK